MLSSYFKTVALITLNKTKKSHQEDNSAKFIHLLMFLIVLLQVCVPSSGLEENKIKGTFLPRGAFSPVAPLLVVLSM